MQDWGVILSGGGLKGAWEAGVLHSIGINSNINFKTLIGTSIGSLVAILSGIGNTENPRYASLMSVFSANVAIWRQLVASKQLFGSILTVIKCLGSAITPFWIFKLLFRKDRLDGTLDPSFLISWLRSHIPYNRVSNSNCYYYLSTTSIDSSDGGLIEHKFCLIPPSNSPRSTDSVDNIPEFIAASMCLPIVFKTVKLANDQQYIDGGLISNIPVEAIVNSGLHLSGILVVCRQPDNGRFLL